MYYKLKGISPKSGKGTVSVVYRQTDFETLKSTGVTVSPNDFNTTTGKVKARVPNHPELNAKIQAVTTCLEMAVRNIIESGRPVTKQALEAQYSIVQLRLMLAKEQEAIQQQLESAEQKPNDRSGVTSQGYLLETKIGNRLTDKITEYLKLNPENYGQNTILGYEDLRMIILKFKPNLALEDISLPLFYELQNHLIKKEMRNQSIRITFARLKKVYTYYADEMDLPIAFIGKFKMVKELYNDNVIFLTDEEVELIEKVELKSKAQNQVRYQFLFSCQVGLRHSDLYITSADIKANELHVTMKKSKHTVKPPLTAKAKAILASEHFPFKVITINQYNKTVRAISKKAGLTDVIKQTHFIGNHPVTITKQKWELMSSHVGRKTAINNWLNKGVRESVVALWAGHQNTKMIQKHYQNKDAASLKEAEKLI
jgi:integrase